MRFTRSLAVGTVALSLVAVAGCGSDKKDEGSSGTTIPVATIAPAKDLKLAQPVKIVALIADPSISKDPNAIADFNDGIKLAINQINEAGGLGGAPIEFKAIDTSPTAVDQATNSLNLALQENPTVLLGPVSSTTALGLAPRIAEAKIPTIANTVEPSLAKSQKGNEWLYLNRPVNDKTAAQATEFASNELNAKKLGLLSTNTAFGKQGADGVKAGASASGAQVTAERSFEFNATDLTEPISAMKDTQAVIDWGTPNTVALAVTTMAQQGIDVPHIGPGSVGFPSFVKQVGDNSLLKNVYGAVDCNPGDDSRPTTQSFVQAFKNAYNYTPGYAAAEMYDSVFMIRNIIEEKGSSAAADIQAGLNSINWSGGTCAQTYTNKDNFLNHQVDIAKFNDQGQLQTVKTYTDL